MSDYSDILGPRNTLLGLPKPEVKDNGDGTFTYTFKTSVKGPSRLTVPASGYYIVEETGEHVSVFEAINALYAQAFPNPSPPTVPPVDRGGAVG